jgi:PAS domain S-box-containing protein
MAEYKRLMKSIGDRYVVYTQQFAGGELTYISSGFESIFGIPREAVINKPWHSVIQWLPGEIEMALQIDAHYEQHEIEHSEYELRFMHPDGNERTIRVTEYPVMDEAGKPKHINGICEDISKRKQFEQLLSQDEKNQLATIQLGRDGTWDWDIATGNVHYNNQWMRILGENSAQQHYSTWENRLHPDDKPGILKTLRAHLAGETVFWQQEHRLRNATGEYTWVLGRGQVVCRDEAGVPLRMVGTMTDISLLKQNEAVDASESSDIADRISRDETRDTHEKADCDHCDIKQTVLCGNLIDETQATAPQTITEHVFSRSEIIFHQGKSDKFIYAIRSGLVKLEIMIPGVGQKIVGLPSRADIIGLETLLSLPYRHTAVAMNDCEVCKIPTAMVDDLRTHSLAFNHELMINWDRANHHAYEWLAKLHTGTSRHRINQLMQFLVNISEIAPEFVMPSRDDIASILGLSRETVSRVIADLRREEILTFYGNGIYELNVSE